jgi:hypothetical protein
MNFKKLIPYAKAEMQKMTDTEFLDAAEVLAKEVTEEYKRRGLSV